VRHADDVIEGNDKIYFRIVEETQKKIKIRIIICYFNNLIKLFKENPRIIITHKSKSLNRDRGKKRLKIILEY